jgi:arylsulfatase A
MLRLTAALLLAPLFAAPASAQPKPPPNIVVVLADDLGYGDLACYGHPIIKTPHLDQFAKEGMRFTQCYSAGSVCSPSRSALLTGRTPYRNGVFTWIPANEEIHLRTSEITIAKLLKEKGYATAHAGKWHLNGHFNSPKHPQPSDHGYDHWLATQNNAGPSHKDPNNFARNGKAVGPMKGFSADLVVDEAIGWLSKERDKARPFFLAVWTHEPHLPIESDPVHQEHYKNIDDADVRQHHGNVTQMDAAFGKLMKALKEMKLEDNTLVFFTSDNGPEGNGLKGRTRGSTGGLRGRKRAMYEGGIRVPGLIRWPGVVKAGSVSEAPIVGSDLFPTLCDIVGVAPPKDRVLDGESFLPVLQGKPHGRVKPMYWRYGGAPGPKIALRVRDWKILADEKLTAFELYNLKDDPKETTDLAKQQPEILDKLRKTLEKLNAEIEAEGPMWWKGYFEKKKG